MPKPNQMPTWFFDKLGPDDMERNPVSEEFFAGGTRLEAVIMESLQNSLDAAGSCYRCPNPERPERADKTYYIDTVQQLRSVFVINEPFRAALSSYHDFDSFAAERDPIFEDGGLFP